MLKYERFTHKGIATILELGEDKVDKVVEKHKRIWEDERNMRPMPMGRRSRREDPEMLARRKQALKQSLDG